MAENFKWFLLGQSVRRGLRKVATMYSYNGVVLPKLPEWDKTVYPYATIVQTTSSGYRLYVQNTPFEMGVNNTIAIIVYGKCFKLTDGNWNEGGAATYGASMVWANHDVYYVENGALYLPTSNPIPVYE